MDLDIDISSTGSLAKEGHPFDTSSETSDMDVDEPNSPLVSATSEGVVHSSADATSEGVVHSSSDSGPSAYVRPERKMRQRVKKGYGIPDDDTTFSHFPEKGRSKPETARLQREHCLPPRQAGKEKCEKHESVSRGIRSCISSLCSLLCKVFVIVAIFAAVGLSAQFLIHLQMQKCLASRQFNAKALATDLESFVFGQHLAADIIPRQFDAYFRQLGDINGRYVSHTGGENSSPDDQSQQLCKPLVLSFHGWTGVGKNFVSGIISSNFLYTKVNHIIIPLHFPHEAMEHTYGEVIRDWIVTNNTDCSVNIIVIDEMDKSFPPVWDGLVQAIEDLTGPCHEVSPTIIILLSNSYATDINRIFFTFVSENPTKRREEIPLSLFQPSFFSATESQWDYALNKHSLIDSQVPFLPLEKEHIVQCIKRELVARQFSTDSESVERILGELTFTAQAGLEVSVTGCKRVSDKVDYVMLGHG